MNEEARAHWGLSRQKKKNKLCLSLIVILPMTFLPPHKVCNIKWDRCKFGMIFSLMSRPSLMGPQKSMQLQSSKSAARSGCSSTSGLQNAVLDEGHVYYHRICEDKPINILQGGSNMTGTDLCVNKPHCAAAVRP